MTFRPSGKGQFFDSVKKKKEKRGRRSPCGLSLTQSYETSMGVRFYQRTPNWNACRETCSDISGVLVKTCIASTTVYIKLESLIMAQNERWRQA